MTTYRFGQCELDARTGELRRDGAVIPLAPKVAELLFVLVQSNGQLLSRAELQERLWPDTHTDRERGLNNAMNRLRAALGDSAGEPRYIDTVPKRGYVFKARVDVVQPPTRVGHLRIAGLVSAALVTAIVVLVISVARKQNRSEAAAPAEYLGAIRKLRFGGVKDLDEARLLLETATKKSPTFAPGYAALASVLLDLVDAGKTDPATARRLAEESAQNSLRLRPDNADAHLALGLVRLRAEWRIRAASDEIERAIKLDPESAEAWRARATLLLARGDVSHAVESSERAVSLDPLSAWVQTASGRAIFYQGDIGRSAERLESTIRIVPEFSPAHRYLSEVYWQAGRKEDARQEFINAVRLGNMDAVEVQRAERISSEQGLAGYWRSELPGLLDQGKRYGVPYKIAVIYAALDQPDQALDWLEQSFQQKDTQMLFLRVNPRFAKLRSIARFQAILQRLPSS